MLDGVKKMLKPIDDMVKPIFPDTDIFWILVFLGMLYYFYTNHGGSTKSMPTASPAKAKMPAEGLTLSPNASPEKASFFEKGLDKLKSLPEKAYSATSPSPDK